MEAAELLGYLAAAAGLLAVACELAWGLKRSASRNAVDRPMYERGELPWTQYKR